MARGPGKGKTNNPKGKPKGVQNSTTIALKEFYVNLMDANREKIQAALDKLYNENPHHYLTAIDKISQKVIANKRDITSDDKPIQPPPIAGVIIQEDEANKQTTTKTD